MVCLVRHGAHSDIQKSSRTGMPKGDWVFDCVIYERFRLCGHLYAEGTSQNRTVGVSLKYQGASRLKLNSQQAKTV